MDWLKRLATNTLGVAALTVGGVAALGTIIALIGSLKGSANALSSMTAALLSGAFAALLIVKGRRWLAASLHTTTETSHRKSANSITMEVPCDDALLAAARAIVRKHIHTLGVERRNRLVPDKYGIADRSSWDSEVTAFCSRVARPHVEETLSERDVKRCLRAAARVARKKVPTVSDDELLLSVLRSVVEAETAAQDTDSAIASPTDLIYSTPAEFEEWCASELRAAGWTASTVGGTGDQGVDVRATRDGTTLVMQCKLYNAPVGNDAVQQVFAGKAFHRAHLAVVVAPNGFTKSARAVAVQTGVHLLGPSEIRGFAPSSTHRITA